MKSEYKLDPTAQSTALTELDSHLADFAATLFLFQRLRIRRYAKLVRFVGTFNVGKDSLSHHEVRRRKDLAVRRMTDLDRLVEQAQAAIRDITAELKRIDNALGT